MPRRKPLTLAGDSFLRSVDARSKLALALAGSLAAMLPLWPLAACCAGFSALALAAGLGGHLAGYLRRLAIFLVALFAFDYLAVGFDFAVLIAMRLLLLVTAFSLLFATTTADELKLALEQLGVPGRLAFTFATAYASLGLLQSEWEGILEAQRARGLFGAETSSSRWRLRLGSGVALLVPAVVLATQRAWTLSESAALRGLESPRRRRRSSPRLGGRDVLLLGLAGGLVVVLLVAV